VAEAAVLDAVEEVEVALAEEVAVVLVPMAAAWKAANWFPGLMAKTMPF